MVLWTLGITVLLSLAFLTVDLQRNKKRENKWKTKLVSLLDGLRQHVPRRDRKHVLGLGIKGIQGEAPPSVLHVAR